MCFDYQNHDRPRLASFEAAEDLIQRFFHLRHSRNTGVCRRMANGKDHQRFVGFWSAADIGEKLHWTRRVRQTGKAGQMQCRDQEPGCDANTFRHIVVLVTGAIIELSVALGKNDDQPGGVNQMWLVGASANGSSALIHSSALSRL